MMKRILPPALYLMAVGIAVYGTSIFVMYFQAIIIAVLAQNIGFDYLFKGGHIGRGGLILGFVSPSLLALISAVIRTFA